MDLQERKVRASLLHSRGYNCAQCILLSFDDYTGLSSVAASSLAMGLGAGVGAQGEVCGALLGVSLVLGMVRGEDPAIKPKVNKEVRELTRRFRERNNDRYLCRELKRVQPVRPCDDIVADSVEILHDYLQETKGQ